MCFLEQTFCDQGLQNFFQLGTIDGLALQAHLVNQQWIADTSSGSAACSDGTTSPENSTEAHYAWDPNTLAGTVQITNKVSVCGNPAGPYGAETIQFRQVA